MKLQRKIEIILLAIFVCLLMPKYSLAQTNSGASKKINPTTKTVGVKKALNNKSGLRSSSSHMQSSKSSSKSQAERDRIIQNLIDNMVYVEGGVFTMGATAEQGSDAYSDEKPAHKVTLSSFYIGKYEVTQAEWQAVMGSNPSNYKGTNLPVEQVSWKDTQEFIRKLNKLTGKTFRLPTEAEWEYAARGGNRTRSFMYSGSSYLGDVAWYSDNSGGMTHAVGSKSPNELGLYDMSGNVSEWCQDISGKYNESSQTNPQGNNRGSLRIVRGGDFRTMKIGCRVSCRGDCPTSKVNANKDLGFRLAL